MLFGKNFGPLVKVEQMKSKCKHHADNYALPLFTNRVTVLVQNMNMMHARAKRIDVAM